MTIFFNELDPCSPGLHGYVEAQGSAWKKPAARPPQNIVARCIGRHLPQLGAVLNYVNLRW